MLEGIFQFYGLDWGALALGLIGCNLITKQQRLGFLLSAGSCICGVIIACASSQYGYIAYNAILMLMMMRGYIGWAKKEQIVALGAE